MEENFTEFQQSSKELEGEMEKEIERAEKKIKEMTSQIAKMRDEHEEASSKSKRISEDSANMISRLQDEVGTLKKDNQMLKKEKQLLETENDSLERKEREIQASLTDITEKLNKALEDNAWLQTELEEQNDRNKEIIQRLKDEVRDLKLELTVSSQPHRLKEMNNAPKFENGGTTTGSINLVNDMLSLVKDMEKRLMSNGVSFKMEKL